jgi:hypothetical protein
MLSNIQDTQELLKKAEIIQNFLGHSRCEVTYKRRENKKTSVLKPNPHFKEKREKEIADFKAFSATLKMPTIME